MVDDTGRIDESRMWQAVERLETASQATHEEQIATNVRMDAMREEQAATNVRMDSMREEQVGTNKRVDAIEKEQIATNVRLDAIGREQSAMNARLDILTLRIDRLFYAIIGGSIAVTVAVVAHGFIAN